METQDLSHPETTELTMLTCADVVHRMLKCFQCLAALQTIIKPQLNQTLTAMIVRRQLERRRTSQTLAEAVAWPPVEKPIQRVTSAERMQHLAANTPQSAPSHWRLQQL